MTTELTTPDFTGLVPVAYIDREKFFLNENNDVQPLIERVKEHYLSIAIDGSTDEGRKSLKKLAAELNTKVIAVVDGFGKDINDSLKAKPKKIDAGRKVIKDALTEVYETILAPVREYDAEQARIKAEAEAKAIEEQRKKDEELARLRAEKAQAERDEQIKREAEEKTRRELEQQARNAELALQREREENQRKEQARLAEIQRQKDDEAKRLADIKHVKEVKNSAFNSLVDNGIEREIAIKVIQLISDKKIDNLTLIY